MTADDLLGESDALIEVTLNRHEGDARAALAEVQASTSAALGGAELAATLRRALAFLAATPALAYSPAEFGAGLVQAITGRPVRPDLAIALPFPPIPHP